MQKSRLYILVTSIGILVIGLVCVQIAWLRSADKKNGEAFALKVNKALATVVRQLEQSIDCVQLFTKYHVSDGEGFYISKQNWKDGGYVGRVDTVAMYYDFTEFRNKGYAGEIPYKYNDFKATYPADVEILINVHFLLNDTLSAIDKAGSTISRKNFREVISSGRPLHELLNMDDVDTVIQDVFRKEGIEQEYAFAFLSGNSKNITYARRVVDSAEIVKSGYQLGVFAGNKFISDHTLYVGFARKAFWSEMNNLLLLSIIIILLLTYAFFTFVKLYFRQNKLSEMKTDFINNLTHEFNTPMANISLALETIEDNKTAIDPKLKHILDIISHESQRLHHNIERALQVATLEKGAIALNKDVIDLAELLLVVEPSYTLQCEQLGGSLSIHFEGDCRILGDETHMLNCIFNLLDNAIKYRQGPPRIDVLAVARLKDVCLLVTDNGKGMSNETQRHIFDKFYRAHEGDTHDTKGFGLGLNYVKGIVEATGGYIEVKSKQGIGTTFILSFPKIINHD